MKKIPMGKSGKFSLVDDEDYEFLMRWKWHAEKGPNIIYAVRRVRVNRKRKVVRMHRVINKTPKHMLTDHINGDGLDNRKCNLRTATHQDNMINCVRWKIGSSKYRGVSWHIRNNNWMAQITVNKKNIYIGAYHTELDAKKAYDKKRAELRKNQIIKE